MKLREKIKKVKNKLKEDEIEEDSDGRAIVRINITDADSLLSVYNDDGKEIISSETATFIDNVTKPFKVTAYSDDNTIEAIELIDLKESVQVMAKIRYRAKEAEAVLHPEKNGMVKVEFKEPQRAITPGQSAVFYIDDIVLGGGKIV